METYFGVMMGLLCCTVLLALFKFFYKFWWVPMRIKNLMRSQGINGPSYSFIYGNAKDVFIMIKRSMSSPMDISHYIFPRIQPHIESWFQLYGKNFLYWQGPQPDLVVSKPELLKDIMSDRDISIRKPDPPPFLRKILGDGLISSQGDKWEKQRKLANYAFHGERLKNMLPAMVESVEMMLKRWKDDGSTDTELDVYEEFKIMTSEVISRTAFGSSYEEGKQVFEKLGDLSVLVAKNTYKIRLPGFGKIFRNKDDVASDKLQAGIRDLIIQMIRSKEKTIISGDEGNSRTDYLGLLLKTHHDIHENYKLSIQDIIDECKTFYSAGHGTTSLLLSWVFLLLGIHTEWQEKARQEVQQVLGKQNPTSEGIARLKTIGMIINETLRLYPPVCSLYRKVPREMEVGNLIFPADINLQIPALALHQDPRIWGEDAHLFNPERFSDGIAKVIDNNPGAFLPFGYGPRICVGSNFAINEAKITLSMILQRYRFTLSQKYVHEPVYHITLRPKSGVQIKFQAL